MTLETLRIEFQADTAGLQGSLSALTGSLDGLDAALEGVTNRAGSVGQQAAEGLANGLLSGMSRVSGAAGQLAEAVRSGQAEAAGPARSAGLAVAEGFARGIRAGTGAVAAAVKRMVDQATGQIRALLGIHSPSKLAGEFGGYFGEGFARGIEGARERVSLASAGLAGAASGGLDAALPGEVRASPGVGAAAADALADRLNITVPLNVDGMRLGEASIRGINAVTRSAGRVMLEI